ncbi:MAG: hypothetical protein K2X06_10425 [Burkholderiales bacterium]|nr:hypothetical protein [Burkholderiales bacterium]
MSRLQSLPAILATGFFCLLAGNAPAQSTAKPAPPMERTEHQWQGGGRSSTFGAHWMGSELKMIREEMAENAGMIEKNEFFFNAGALLHYKQDRYPAPGKSGAAVAIMASFDKTGKPAISLKRVDGKPLGPASPEEIAQAQKHLAELLVITAKVKR